MSLDFDPQQCLAAIGQLRTYAEATRRAHNDPPTLGDGDLGKGFTDIAPRLNRFLVRAYRTRQSHSEVIYGISRKAENTVKSLVEADGAAATNLTSNLSVGSGKRR
ncbi:MAG: hypothetical protein Q3972_00075 [Corynebacterium sp.]|nr:hypothetical protein [Corynebacterium sp.]